MTATTATPEAATESSGGLLRGGVGVGAATAFASAANYASNILLGRGLGPSEFADAALVVSGLLLLGAVALGLQLSAARTVVEGADSEHLRRVRRRAATLGALVGAFVVAAAPILSAWLNMGSATPFMVLGLGIPVYFAMAIGRGITQGRHQFGRLAASIGVEAVVRLLVTAGCLLGGLGATSAAIALTASFVVAALPCRLGDAEVRFRSGTGAPTHQAPSALVLLLFGQVVVSNADLWLVAARAHDEAGVYASVALIGRLVFIAATSVVTVVFPSLVADKGAGDARRLIGQAVVVTAAMGGALTIGAAMFADVLVDVMVGDGYAGGVSLLWPYALGTTLFVTANVLAVADVARGSAIAPGLLAVGGVMQAGVLYVGAPAGASWIVWTRVGLMGGLLVATALGRFATAPGRGWRPAEWQMAPRRVVRPA